VVKNQLCLRPLLGQVESGNRIVTGFPIDDTPCLDNPLVRHEFYLSSHNVPAENRKCAAHLAADFGSLRSQWHRLHGSAELHDLCELPDLCESVVDTLAARPEGSLLVYRLRSVGNDVLDVGESG
jgi:hypothetical protein